ncbi:hypothetical protein SprV_0401731100 [Sparganum proliferum]
MALPQVEIFEDELPLIRSCPALNEIRVAQDIKDLTIEVKNGNVLHAHRIILAARIPYLRGALSGHLNKENSVLRWPTMPLGLATTFIQYVYTGQLEMTQSNVMGIVVLARMVNLTELVNWGTTFMVNGVSLENLPSIWDFARSQNIELLTEKCISLMKTHFEEFVRTDLFTCLPADTLLTLLRSEDLSVGSEELVIGAIARWVPDMLKEVQWHQTSVQCRDRIMEDYPIIWKIPECALLMARIANWIGAGDKNKPPCPFNLRPRHTVFLLGTAKDRSGWSVLRFDPHEQKAERFADMERRRNASFSIVGESIFVVGGQSGSRRVDEFLVKEKRWRERAPLAVARECHAVTVVKVRAAAAATAAANGEEVLIGVFGGSNGSALSSCEVYDVRQDRWHKLPDLREKRRGPAAACLPGDSRVFVFGGGDFSSSSYTASVVFCHLRADWREKVTSADFWLSAASMRSARWGLAATPFRGAILVAGGYDGQKPVNIVEMFSLPDAKCPLGQWTELAGMKQPRSWFTLLTSSNTVFALGNEDEPHNTVEALTAPGGSADFTNDAKSWIWSSKGPVESFSWIHGAVSIPMHMSAFFDAKNNHL